MSDARIEPQDVIQMVESYVSKQLHDAEKYTNSEPLDQSGVWSLHALAATIYARGFEDGERAESERNNGQRRREREAEIAAADAASRVVL
ncbi:hypothetical protein [Rhodococcus sp. 15-2388-1-1a]|uniref:hypothetical protein n=1 Tax=Rhodococcus sp. 15-2388-1-1a TaxID=2023142 RepID=UPI0020CE6C44|nr:hypothetical protein [Rhodococcus sp. 15-2388-1-1a]